MLKVLVTHHPFIALGPRPGPTLRRTSEALAAVVESELDMLLAGHLHIAYSGDLRAHHAGAEHGDLAYDEVAH